MNLTKDFTLEELIHSDLANRLNIKNLPTDGQVYNLTALAQDVLQPVRDYLGAPIKVNSGFRNAALNKVIKGKPTSQHLNGEAADIECEKVSNKELFDAIVKLGVFDQIVNEHNFAWVHVSHKADGGDRHQILKL